MRSNTFGRRSRRKKGSALPGWRLAMYLKDKKHELQNSKSEKQIQRTYSSAKHSMRMVELCVTEEPLTEDVDADLSSSD
jgi:hypothetical protein